MITWTYKGLPKTDWDREVGDDTYYSHRVLVWAQFASGKDLPEPRMAIYIRYEGKLKGLDHWMVDGMTGNVKVIAWSYINKPDENEPT